ncbi:MAG TPA: cytochrome c biogenesis CcdA family protein [Mycobacterium sp.]|nr:cytochrome c biogenesis CcdA family protein [Mycobacterium sp.]
MSADLLGLAFAAGLVAALNPCGFAMLPAYLALVVEQSGARRFRAVVRAVSATVAMTVGFIAVFAVFGALTVPLANTVQRYLPIGTVVVGLLLIGIGGWLALGRSLRVPVPRVATDSRWAPTARTASMLGYGVAYAVASLSCTVGPFLAVTAAASRGGTFTGTVTVYLAYAGGFALVVGTLAVATAVAGDSARGPARWLRRALPIVNRVGGILVLAVGAYVAYYGVYELRLFSGRAGPADPVIDAAGRLQGTLAGWVHSHGGLPWLMALAALLVVSTLWAWRRRRRT